MNRGRLRPLRAPGQRRVMGPHHKITGICHNIYGTEPMTIRGRSGGVGSGKGPTTCNDDEGIFVSADLKCFRKGV